MNGRTGGCMDGRTDGGDIERAECVRRVPAALTSGARVHVSVSVESLRTGARVNVCACDWLLYFHPWKYVTSCGDVVGWAAPHALHKRLMVSEAARWLCCTEHWW